MDKYYGLKPLAQTLYRAGVMGYWRRKPPETYPAGARYPAGVRNLGGLPIPPGTLTPEGRVTLAERNTRRREWGGIWAIGLRPDPFNPSVRFNGVEGRSPQDWTDIAAYGVNWIYERYNDKRNEILHQLLRNALGQFIDYDGNVVAANRAVWAHPGPRAALLSNNQDIRRQAEKHLRDSVAKEWHKARVHNWDWEKTNHFYKFAKDMEKVRSEIYMEEMLIKWRDNMDKSLDELFKELLEGELKEAEELAK